MSEKSITVDVGLTEARAIDSFVTRGDWSQLAPQDRARAYVQVCAQHGLNALSQPFAFLRLNGKEVLYATRGATDQLAAKHSITREIIDGPKIVDIAGTKVALCTARATLPTGRSETGTATLPVADPVNLYMKLETKAKRRATIALLGLAMLDETELATIPDRSQADAPQPSREDLERAVVEVQQPKALPALATLGVEVQPPAVTTAPADARPAEEERGPHHEDAPPPAKEDARPTFTDLLQSIRQCAAPGDVADRWVAAADDLRAWSAGEREACWTEAVQRVMALLGASKAIATQKLKAAVDARKPKGPGPRGGTPKPSAPAQTEAQGDSIGTRETMPAPAQASADAWRETAKGITAHVATLGPKHIENSGRLHLRAVPEALQTHAVHAYAGRLQRLSHDGTSALAWDECVHRAETWLREGPRVATLRPREPAGRELRTAGGAR